MRKLLFGMMVMCFVVAAQATDPEADAIVGEWYTKDAKALVQIYRSDDVYNGKIVWLKEPTYEDGTEKVDKNNPDEARRGDRIIGMNLVKGFAYKGDRQWADGSIYDPDNGKTYSCKMTLKGEELHVRGFIGISLIGRSQVWHRKN